MSPSVQGELLRTSLHQRHLAAAARMVPFGGWDMPVQYRSILAEHRAVREGVGLFDLSHMGRLHFAGEAGRALLQRVTTNDVSALRPGRAQYSLICDERGGILDDTIVYNLGENYLLVVNASNRNTVLDWLARHAGGGMGAGVEDRTLETTMIGVQGPRSQELLQRVCSVDLQPLRYYAGERGRVLDRAALVARTGYTGEDGFELIVSAEDGPIVWDSLESLVDPVQPSLCGLGARDTLRLEAGMALYGHELSEAVNPYEAGLGRVVKLAKGDFVGREALQALSAHPPSRCLVGFQMTDNAVPRQGCRIIAGGAEAGLVTSGTFSPTLRRSIGMAYVTTELAEPNTAIDVEIRERAYPATVVTLPHVPHRTKRISATSKSE